MTYCTQCGQPLAPSAEFCTRCGAHTMHAAPADSPALPSVQFPSVTVAAKPLPSVQKRSAWPLVLIVLGILALVAVIGIGGIVYVGYRVKEKVSSVAEAVSHPAPDAAKLDASSEQQAAPANQDATALLGNLGSLLGGGDDDGDPVEAISDKDPVVPCTSASLPDQAGARVPLNPGTVITTAWGIVNGDVESRNSVDSRDATSSTFSNVMEPYKDDSGHAWDAQSSTQAVCNEDFAQSNLYTTGNWEHLPRINHGVTRLRLSDKSFQEIKSTGQTYHVYWYFWNVSADAVAPAHYAGVLKRVEPQDVQYPLIVNDQRVSLPAIHLTGIVDSIGKNPIPKKKRGLHIAADIYVVDDALDPLVLMYKAKDPAWQDGKFRVEVTKINFPVAQPVNLVEKQLAETKRAVTWGIYFDFNKDTIKPESTPVLKQIVQAMTDNPDWKLTVAGNTDNIGGDVYNLDLSKRRAAAVKQALITQYAIAPDRLSTDGYGALHPIETNDTLEGRARNRRVELTRE